MTNVVTCSDEDITFVISGSCNMCGGCCSPAWCNTDYMLDGNPTCSFHQDNLCRIFDMSAEELDSVSDRQLLYWSTNCLDFPFYLADQNATVLKSSLDVLGWPYDECGYTLTVVSSSE